MRETSANVSNRMAFSKIDPKMLVDLISKAILALPVDADGMILLEGTQYYYTLEPEDAYMKELTLPPLAEDVGDLVSDVEFMELEYERGVSDPAYLLERCSHVLRFLATQTLPPKPKKDVG